MDRLRSYLRPQRQPSSPQPTPTAPNEVDSVKRVKCNKSEASRSGRHMARLRPPDFDDGLSLPPTQEGPGGGVDEQHLSDEQQQGHTCLNATPVNNSTNNGSSATAPSSVVDSSVAFVDSAFSSTYDLSDMRCDLMTNYLRQQQEERLWTSSHEDEGVVLKMSRGKYVCCPASLADIEGGLRDAVQELNVKVAMTVDTKITKLILQNTSLTSVPLLRGLRLQILPNISFLARCQKHQFAAFIKDRGQLIVWEDSPKLLPERADRILKDLIDTVWQDVTSDTSREDKEDGPARRDGLGKVFMSASTDVEKDLAGTKRTVMLFQPFLTGIVLFLTVAALGAGCRRLAMEIAADGSYLRLCILAAVPAQIWLSLFFFQCVCGNLLQLFGPVAQCTQNSKYYSGKPPRRLGCQPGRSLPHVTIQMPVYKEGLKTVIEPTVRSIKAAISTYEMQGGSANIFVNDDGMQLLEEDQAYARQDFFDEHNIGWTARPIHAPERTENGGVEQHVFHRRGKFKKASNMNYGLWVTNRVEDKLTRVQREEEWETADEDTAYRESLDQVLAEDQGRTWANGNIRIGDYILIVDSDTRVPNDCFLDAVSEMEQSPQVAILQYTSGVMNVTGSFFENGITFFTGLIYTSIKYAVANGDTSPFIGHNAILRWSAIQQVGFECPLDAYEKYWSEETVSEDFDMSLRLQTASYLVRFATYTGNGFKEGVSLTVYDELARWEKYAYGCSELCFNPLRRWLSHGPFTTLFCRFARSCIPLGSKVTIMAYVGTYYAIASAWILTLANYFATGWFNGVLDHYYIDSFKVFVAIVVVFSGLGNIALAVLRYRIDEAGILPALFDNFRWVLLLAIYLGGISLHVSQAIICHMFSVEMSWGATAKEVERSTFFEEIGKVLKRFKMTFTFCVGSTAMMVILAYVVPWNWQIRLFIAVFPLGMAVFGHFLLPLALNPSLMLFTW